MTCCPSNITSFAAESITTVPYTGARPIVSVAYLMPDGTFQTAGIFTQIEITPTEIIIDHGEVASGIIKLL